MGSYGLIRISEIKDMLAACAEGYEWIDKPHNYHVKWAGKVYPALPKGPHGRRSARTEIEVGHVRKMARFLGILDCAKEILPLT